MQEAGRRPDLRSIPLADHCSVVDVPMRLQNPDVRHTYTYELPQCYLRDELRSSNLSRKRNWIDDGRIASSHFFAETKNVG